MNETKRNTPAMTTDPRVEAVADYLRHYFDSDHESYARDILAAADAALKSDPRASARFHLERIHAKALTWDDTDRAIAAADAAVPLAERPDYKAGYAEGYGDGCTASR